ncbi:type II secretion system minor pseudopilin GspJ [Acinetobacter junii]|jgi:general secretion pathway protein J|uniref:type II secretion system minor pseudopilin GspJ n=1 Tax=Acinetobacter junii TaxID=40215 RepID=UPI0002CD7832|nr:type II secretion system minor pseudopilin GspJ [Acinetobacter junii]ENV62956.1 type II secretion system protein J [Acinetobacter junii NIPH 182]
MKIKNVVMRLGFIFNVVSECQQSSTKSYLPKKIKSNLGFTLVELLVAIAIFAVLSMLGWKVFDYLIKVKDRNAEHETHLFELQDAYQQFLKDSMQIIPLTANDGRQLQAAMVLNDRSFSFSKAGVSDPLKQGLSPYERIEYRYDVQQKKVYRLKYTNLNIPNRVQPVSSTLLENVDQFRIVILNPQEISQWPENINDPNNVNELKKLPLGFKVQLTIAGSDYEWIYSLLNANQLLVNQETPQ